jgi:hypothetical protein
VRVELFNGEMIMHYLTYLLEQSGNSKSNISTHVTGANLRKLYLTKTYQNKMDVLLIDPAFKSHLSSKGINAKQFIAGIKNGRGEYDSLKNKVIFSPLDLLLAPIGPNGDDDFARRQLLKAVWAKQTTREDFIKALSSDQLRELLGFSGMLGTLQNEKRKNKEQLSKSVIVAQYKKYCANVPRPSSKKRQIDWAVLSNKTLGDDTLKEYADAYLWLQLWYDEDKLSGYADANKLYLALEQQLGVYRQCIAHPTQFPVTAVRLLSSAGDPWFSRLKTTRAAFEQTLIAQFSVLLKNPSANIEKLLLFQPEFSRLKTLYKKHGQSTAVFKKSSKTYYTYTNAELFKEGALALPDTKTPEPGVVGADIERDAIRMTFNSGSKFPSTAIKDGKVVRESVNERELRYQCFLVAEFTGNDAQKMVDFFYNLSHQQGLPGYFYKQLKDGVLINELAQEQGSAITNRSSSRIIQANREQDVRFMSCRQQGSCLIVDYAASLLDDALVTWVLEVDFKGDTPAIKGRYALEGARRKNPGALKSLSPFACADLFDVKTMWPGIQKTLEPAFKNIYTKVTKGGRKDYFLNPRFKLPGANLKNKESLIKLLRFYNPKLKKDESKGVFSKRHEINRRFAKDKQMGNYFNWRLLESPTKKQRKQHVLMYYHLREAWFGKNQLPFSDVFKWVSPFLPTYLAHKKQAKALTKKTPMLSFLSSEDWFYAEKLMLVRHALIAGGLKKTLPLKFLLENKGAVSWLIENDRRGQYVDKLIAQFVPSLLRMILKLTKSCQRLSAMAENNAAATTQLVEEKQLLKAWRAKVSEMFDTILQQYTDNYKRPNSTVITTFEANNKREKARSLVSKKVLARAFRSLLKPSGRWFQSNQPCLFDVLTAEQQKQLVEKHQQCKLMEALQTGCAAVSSVTISVSKRAVDCYETVQDSTKQLQSVLNNRSSGSDNDNGVVSIGNLYEGGPKPKNPEQTVQPSDIQIVVEENSTAPMSGGG